MKKFGLCTILAMSVFCFLSSLNPAKAYATPVIMDFTGVGGANSGGVFTYPYYFTINGVPTVPLMCVSYLQEIYLSTPNETWQATITPIGTATTTPPGLTATEEEEDAYLDSVILNPSSSVQTTSSPAQIISDAQWAAWEVGDSAMTCRSRDGDGRIVGPAPSARFRCHPKQA